MDTERRNIHAVIGIRTWAQPCEKHKAGRHVDVKNVDIQKFSACEHKAELRRNELNLVN